MGCRGIRLSQRIVAIRAGNQNLESPQRTRRGPRYEFGEFGFPDIRRRLDDCNRRESQAPMCLMIKFRGLPDRRVDCETVRPAQPGLCAGHAGTMQPWPSYSRRGRKKARRQNYDGDCCGPALRGRPNHKSIIRNSTLSCNKALCKRDASDMGAARSNPAGSRWDSRAGHVHHENRLIATRGISAPAG